MSFVRNDPFIMQSVAVPIRANNTVTVFGNATTTSKWKQRILAYVVDWEGEVQTSTIFYSQGSGTNPMKQGDKDELSWSPATIWNKDMRVTMEYQYALADGGELDWIQGTVDGSMFTAYPVKPVADTATKLDLIPTERGGDKEERHVTMSVTQMPLA